MGGHAVLERPLFPTVPVTDKPLSRTQVGVVPVVASVARLEAFRWLRRLKTRPCWANIWQP